MYLIVKNTLETESIYDKLSHFMFMLVIDVFALMPLSSRPTTFKIEPEMFVTLFLGTKTHQKLMCHCSVIETMSFHQCN